MLSGVTFVAHLLLLGFSGEKVHPCTWLLLPFLGYAAINVTAVSPVPWLGWRDWLGWTQMIGTFLVVINGVRRRGPRLLLFGSILALAVAAVILAAYQRFLWPDWLMLGRKQAPQFFGRASGPFGIPNSLAAFLLLVIPLLMSLTVQRGASAYQRIICGYLCAVLLFGLGVTISRGAWLSLLGALLVWPLCLKERTWEWRVTASVAATTVALLAGVVTYTTVPQVKQRFDLLVSEAGERTRPVLWKGAWSLFREKPVLGTGAGSYNIVFERHRPAGFRDEPQWAHNDYLNTLSDYGAIGFLLSFGAIGCVAYRSANYTRNLLTAQTFFASQTLDSPDVTRGLVMGLLAFALSLLVDFHLKIPAVAMLAAVVGAEALLRAWPVPPAGETGAVRQIVSIVAALTVGLVTLGVALPTYRSEALRYSARQDIDHLALLPDPSIQRQKEIYGLASQAFAEAAVLQPANAQAWADRAYVAELWSRLAPARANELGQEAEEAARNALKCSEIVPEFWIRLGVALDLQGRWGEGGQAFLRAIQLAPANATAWYYQAYHLSLTPATHALAMAAVNRSLSLDPSFGPAISLHQGLSLPR